MNRRSWIEGYVSLRAGRTLHTRIDCGRQHLKDAEVKGRPIVVERVLLHSMEDHGHYAVGHRIGYPKPHGGRTLTGKVWLCGTCAEPEWRSLPPEPEPERLAPLRILAGLPVEQRHELMRLMHFETESTPDDADYAEAVEVLAGAMAGEEAAGAIHNQP